MLNAMPSLPVFAFARKRASTKKRSEEICSCGWYSLLVVLSDDSEIKVQFDFSGDYTVRVRRPVCVWCGDLSKTFRLLQRTDLKKHLALGEIEHLIPRALFGRLVTRALDWSNFGRLVRIGITLGIPIQPFFLSRLAIT